MSNPDSFIDEVSEEVRRDRLFRLMRRYGWIPLLAVLAIVGGAAWYEWQRAQADATAQARGDAILSALGEETAEARVEALEQLSIEGEAAVVAQLTLAAEQQRDGNDAAAAQTLRALAENGNVPVLYRDLASLKALMLNVEDVSAEDRLVALEALSAPGAPFRMLALEQIALVRLSQGDAEAAIAQLREISEAAEVTPGLRDRVTGLMVALGEDPETLAGATAAPTDPVEAAEE